MTMTAELITADPFMRNIGRELGWRHGRMLAGALRLRLLIQYANLTPAEKRIAESIAASLSEDFDPETSVEQPRDTVEVES